MIINSLLKKKKNPYLCLAICILLTSILLYWQYIFGDKVFVFNDVAGDTNSGYVPIYEYFAMAIKSGTLNDYVFQFGYGNSIFSMISFVSDPFSMIGVLTGVIFGEQYIADSLVYIAILKHICAGLLCLCFLKEYKFSEKSSMICAYLYSFSSYIVTLGEHYFFANSVVYFVLFLVAIEKTVKGKHKIRSWILLVIASALATAGGTTIAYEELLFAGFYTLVRVIYLYGKNVKDIFRRLGICLAFVVSGICISSFILLPRLGKISGSNRLVQTANILAFNSPDVIKTSVLRLFSTNLEGTFNSWYGAISYYTNCFSCFFSVMLVPVTAQYIWRTFRDSFSVKCRIVRLIPIAAVVFAIVNQFIPLLSSFFVPHYHTFVYIFTPAFAAIFADVLDNLELGKFNRVLNYFAMVLSVLVIAWGGITTYNKGGSESLMWMFFSAGMVILGCFIMDIIYLTKNSDQPLNFNVLGKTASTAFAVLLVVNLFSEDYISLNYKRAALSKELEHMPLLIDEIADDINESEKDNFFRVETTYAEGKMTGRSYPFLFPLRMTAYYDTSIDNDVPELYSKIFQFGGLMHFNNYLDACGKANNTITADIMGIKYLLLPTEFPRNGWEKTAEYSENKLSVYKNSGINSAGLLFDSYITEEQADNMPADQKVLGLAERLIVDIPPENLRAADEKVFKNDDGVPAIDCNSAGTFLGSISDISLSESKCNIKAVMNGDTSNIQLPFNTEIINDSKKSTLVTVKLKDSSVLKNIVYFDFDNLWKELKCLDPVVEEDGMSYKFIVPQTASHFAICVNKACELDCSISSKTANASYTNSGIQLDNPGRGDVVTGTVSAEKDSLLYLPIAHDKGWSAYVDGQKTELLNANYAFMAITVPEGEHRVDFIYSNKAYRFGLNISLTTITLLTIFFIVYYFVNKRKKKLIGKKAENDLI